MDTVGEIPTALKIIMHCDAHTYEYDICILFKAKFLTKEAK